MEMICKSCHRSLCEGYTYIKYKGEMFCDEDCLKDELLEEADYEEVYVESEYDKKWARADEQWDSMEEGRF